MIEAMRDADCLSNAERDELLFFWLSGTDSEAIFGVPEYVIFPTFITSPVFTSTVVQLQHGRRSEHHTYSSFRRTMQQTRDLLTTEAHFEAQLRSVGVREMGSLLVRLAKSEVAVHVGEWRRNSRQAALGTNARRDPVASRMSAARDKCPS